MEEFDSLLQAPDESGKVDLSHQAWVTVDESLWDWGETLKSLNLSFNRIQVLPPKIGKLVFLRELDLTHNALETLPSEIALCVRLRILRVSRNHLRYLPDRIAELKLLEELYLSENYLIRLPETMGELKALRILHLQSNKLESVCPELSQCISLEELDCTNNVHITNIPQPVLGDTKLIMWQCQHNLKQKKTVEELEEANDDLEQAAEEVNQEQNELRDKLTKLEELNRQLMAERPQKFLKFLENTEKVKTQLCCIQ